MAEPELTIPLLAGHRPDGQPVFENVAVLAGDQPNRFMLRRSPLFVPGVAQGDVIDLEAQQPGLFRLVERSGQLAIRVITRDRAESLSQMLTPVVERIDGRLDVESERALVYSIHVAVGFRTIERLFDAAVSNQVGRWSYGNVYHPESGKPLGWWESMLST